MGASMSNGKLIVMIAVLLTVINSAAPARAVTINVKTTGAPNGTQCSLTEAIQAAMTNAAVGKCIAGKSTETDIVQLEAKTYQNYGKALLIPAGSSAGPLIIRGVTDSSNQVLTGLVGRNYGFPSPNPINPYVCSAEAALYTGGSNVTIRAVNFDSDGGPNHGGICQYAGSLALDNMEVYGFKQGGIHSAPNVNETRTLKMTLTDIVANTNSTAGGGLALYGNMTIDIATSYISLNRTTEGGGGIDWNASGTLKITDTNIFENWAMGSMGGGLFLTPLNTSATVTLAGASIQNNTADQEGGAAFVQLFGNNKLILKNGNVLNTFFHGNTSGFGAAENTFNSASNQAYTAISCTQSTSVPDLNVAPWTSHTPRLKGDGTCSFP